MRLIKLNPVVEATLLSSTVPEDDYAAWSGATTYGLGDLVIRTQTHRVYESLTAGNLNNIPENTTIIDLPSGPKWLDVSATNRWKMFDAEVNSQTVDTTELIVELDTASINSFAMFALVGSSYSAEFRDNLDNLVYETGAISLDASSVADWYDYFFAEFNQIEQAVHQDIPVYASGTLKVTITGTNVACGQLSVGYSSFLGKTEYGATAGIIDYSKKETDVFGNTTFLQRAYSKRVSARLWLDNSKLNNVHRLLSSVRATPCVFVGTEEITHDYDVLAIYGFYKDFALEVAYFSTSYCSLEIEGLI